MNTPESPGASDASSETLDLPSSRTPWLVAAAAVLIVLVVGGLLIANLGDDDDPGDEVVAPPLQLALGADDPMASCLRPEPAILADMAPAFAATATAIEGEIVTLEVDRWYTDGDATVVELQAQPGMEALIAGFAFEVGTQYLITATNGSVNFCGYSGPATPDFLAFFDEAFPS